MDKNLPKEKQGNFHALKVKKKAELTKRVFSLEFEILEEKKHLFSFEAGQYVTLKFPSHSGIVCRDYSITSAPYEGRISIGVKIGSEESSAFQLFKNYQVGDFLEVSEPKGRFILPSKPHEFRTILGFASGIGITPILSHFKNILHNEPRTRLFLFYGNQNREEVAFQEELNFLQEKYGKRLEIYYFFSQEKVGNSLLQGRLNEAKLKLIINQILNLDETDEESTIWDAVDEVLICGKPDMVKSIANGCYENGILKRNIHFELFEELETSIFPIETTEHLLSNIEVSMQLNRYNYTTTIPDNSTDLLAQLLSQGFKIPYSCKSGVCGICMCKLEEGNVELFENEYLTDKEEQEGKILVCCSVATSKKIKINFDEV